MDALYRKSCANARGTPFHCKGSCLAKMKGHKRLKKIPHEDSYLTIFSRQAAPRPRRKQLWPDKLSLATKKRLLACHAHGEPFQTSTEAKKQDEVTLEDCWPSDELTLQWLKLGREKMDAFQAALRRRLSAPVEACHWPLRACSKCARTPLYARGILNLSIPSATCQFEGGLHDGVVSPQGGAVALRALDSRNDVLSGDGGSERTCCSTYVRNCALVISEDPLLRPSLLAISLGISEVHTVVMKEANWESAATFAKCFGRPGSLKVFRSLEALEQEVFEHRVCQVLTGEVTLSHTCRGAANSGCQPRGDPVAGSVLGVDGQHHCQDLCTGTTKPDGIAEGLQAHLHRYRVVLIDDQYCGPIVSAFGLPLLLEFVRTHTCPACCLVVPRRWQTLATPASCPPLVASNQYLKRLEGEKLSRPRQRRLAASGRTMSGASIRLEDVVLSGRFCVLESYELTSLVRCTYKDPEVELASGLCTRDTEGGENLSKKGSTAKDDLEDWLSKKKALQAKCPRCARDRQLRWSKERQTIVNGNAVCGVEIAGPCAGLIVRSHIVFDEGITLFPSAPLMVFLPDEVQLSTRHVVMLGPAVLSEHTRAMCASRRGSTNSCQVEAHGMRPARSTTLEACESLLDISIPLQEKEHEGSACTFSCNSPEDTRVTEELQTGRPPVPPWRNLKTQQPTYCWQWTAVCDGMRQSEFDIHVTLRDLLQTAREEGVEGLSSPENPEAI